MSGWRASCCDARTRCHGGPHERREPARAWAAASPRCWASRRPAPAPRGRPGPPGAARSAGAGPVPAAREHRRRPRSRNCRVDPGARHTAAAARPPAPADAGRYQIIAGERRWRAAGPAGLHEVPALVRDLADTEAMAAVALVENLQRQDLNPIEEAEGYRAAARRVRRSPRRRSARPSASRAATSPTRCDCSTCRPAVKESSANGRDLRRSCARAAGPPRAGRPALREVIDRAVVSAADRGPADADPPAERTLAEDLRRSRGPDIAAPWSVV